MQSVNTEKNGFSLQNLLFVFGFFFASLGFLNSIPDVGYLPSIGVIPAAVLHSLVMAAGLVIVLVTLASRMDESTPFPKVQILFHVLLVGLALFALWRYYVDMTAISEEGLFFFDESHAWLTVAGALVILYFCWRIWGAPLALVGLAAFLYFFFGDRMPGIMGHAGMDFVEDTPAELWFNTGDGILGNIMAILVNTVFPFIIMGAVLEGTGGGGSMIKISFHAMRRFRGGPAHAAIMASSLFGTVSGSAVANVVGTGVITIPMIKKRGFNPAFAGGVEATASTGGQIVPPIMGAAALVMADFLGVSYLTIILAAIIPALAYYLSLFATVVFESRSLGVEASENEEIDPVTRQDWINLILVVVPVTTVIVGLVMGFSPAGSAMLALSFLMALSFLNPEIRQRPILLAKAFAGGGMTFGRLLMAIGTVGLIVAVLSATGLPLEFAKVISASAGDNLLFALCLAGISALALGMGMPTLPAYLTIVIILGPALIALGLSQLTAHFFVFYFGVASAITPPVAMAAFAAASISGAGAISTAVQATRIGIVIFAIPFMFAFNPEMLIVAEAGGDFSWLGFGWILIRLAMLIYLLASAASRYDRHALSLWEVLVRMGAALLMIHPDLIISLPAFAVCTGLLLAHWMFHSKSEKRELA